MNTKIRGLKSIKYFCFYDTDSHGDKDRDVKLKLPMTAAATMELESL